MKQVEQHSNNIELEDELVFDSGRLEKFAIHRPDTNRDNKMTERRLLRHALTAAGQPRQLLDPFATCNQQQDEVENATV